MRSPGAAADAGGLSEVVAPPALGPGDDDPRSPARVLGPDTARAPLGPGDQDGIEPDFDVMVPPALGPGDTPFVRHVTRISRPRAATIAADEE